MEKELDFAQQALNQASVSEKSQEEPVILEKHKYKPGGKKPSKPCMGCQKDTGPKTSNRTVTKG